MPLMKLGIIGSGSWATALAKILTDNRVPINWLVRNDKTVEHIVQQAPQSKLSQLCLFRYQSAYI